MKKEKYLAPDLAIIEIQGDSIICSSIDGLPNNDFGDLTQMM